jgi:hypothetical protein
MNDLLLLLTGLSSGIAFTWFIMLGRIEDSKAETRAWVRACIKLEEELGINK